jgi:hypothetical protein
MRAFPRALLLSSSEHEGARRHFSCCDLSPPLPMLLWSWGSFIKRTWDPSRVHGSLCSPWLLGACMLDSPDLVDQRDPSSLGDKKFLQNSLVLGLSLGPNKSLMNSTFNGEVPITVEIVSLLRQTILFKARYFSRRVVWPSHLSSKNYISKTSFIVI